VKRTTLIPGAHGQSVPVIWEEVNVPLPAGECNTITLTATLKVTLPDGKFDLGLIAAELADAQKTGRWLDETEVEQILGLDRFDVLNHGAVQFSVQGEDALEQFCAHGKPTRDHPNYAGRCPDCDREEYADIVCDLRRGT
jgi:hypothetical protein